MAISFKPSSVRINAGCSMMRAVGPFFPLVEDDDFGCFGSVGPSCLPSKGISRPRLEESRPSPARSDDRVEALVDRYSLIPFRRLEAA